MRIEGRLDPPHQRDRLRLQLEREERRLGEADPVLAADRAAEPDDLLRAGGRSAYLSDTGKPVFIPTETRSYPLVHFLKVAEAYDN